MSSTLFKEIINNGHYQTIRSYSGKNALVELTTKHTIETIEFVSGKEIAESVKKYGLERMHEFVNPDSIQTIQSILGERLKKPLLKLTKQFSKENMGLGEEFYLDLKVIARIKFPFEVARKSKVSYLDYSREQGRQTFEKPPELTSGYHRNLPFPAWAHGPHADSWFGHSYDGINLWWGIAGVNEESGMTFYPEYVGSETLSVIDEPPYLAKDNPLTKPVFFNLDPGDVIVFNSDTLHGTRVNHSGLTRVSLSTRINPNMPRFNTEQFRHIKYWVKASDLEKMLEHALPTGEQSHRLTDNGFDITSNPYIYIAKKEDPGTCDGIYGNTCKKTASVFLKSIKLDEPASSDIQINIAPSDQLKMDEKLLIEIGHEKIVIARTSRGLRALTAICPHIGYNLAAGGHTDSVIFCNGHGLAFDWDSGLSGCSLYKVKTHVVEEINGQIYLMRETVSKQANA